MNDCKEKIGMLEVQPVCGWVEHSLDVLWETVFLDSYLERSGLGRGAQPA